MKITYENNGELKKIQCGKTNVFYGYNSSGKTKIAKTLLDGFQMKSKSLFLVDGFQLSKAEYEIYFIDGKQSIEEQLKFTSKSLLRKYLIDKIINSLNNDDNLEDYLNNKFNKAILDIKDKVNILSNKDSKITIDLEIDMIEDLIEENITIKLFKENESDSNKRIILFNLLFALINDSSKKGILIFDDFDNFLDEENTLLILNKISSIDNLNSFLFTSNPYSLYYSFNRYNIYCIRNSNICNLTNIKSMIISCLSEDIGIDEIIDSKLFIDDYEINSYIDLIRRNIGNTLGRMITNSNYSINKDSNIAIYTSNNVEYKYLIEIDKIIQSL